MKTSFISDLNSEQNITSFFLVCEKELRNTSYVVVGLRPAPLFSVILGKAKDLSPSSSHCSSSWDLSHQPARIPLHEDFVYL